MEAGGPTHTISRRISFSLRLTFLMMVSSPMLPGCKMGGALGLNVPFDSAF